MFASVATLAATTLFIYACGGGDNSAGAKSANNTASSSASSTGSSPSTDNSAGSANNGTSASTTLAVGDNGAGGQKLNPASSATPAASGSAHEHQSEVGRSRDDIRAIVLARRDDARACYDAALPSHPGIEGDLTIKWTIDPDGNVTDLALDSQRSSILEPSVVTCVSDVIKKIKFSRSSKGFETHAFYPFNFHPKNTPRVRDAGT